MPRRGYAVRVRISVCTGCDEWSEAIGGTVGGEIVELGEIPPGFLYSGPQPAEEWGHRSSAGGFDEGQVPIPA